LAKIEEVSYTKENMVTSGVANFGKF